MIELKNISKTFNKGKENEKKVLNKININITKGEMVAIMGPSGAGKTTLLNILSGLTKFDEGEYFFNGENISSFSDSKMSLFRNERLGIIMQDFALINEYTSIENVMIPLLFRKGINNKKTVAKNALEEIGISHLSNKYVSTLSGGEKQRVAIARCICQNPDIILADEPTGQLDTKTSEEIMGIFKNLNSRGITILIVTHNEELAKKCNKILKIYDGIIK